MKTGHLVGASPRSQFIGQMVGSVFSAVLGVGFWVLFVKAYPCILEGDCGGYFPMTACTAWKAVTVALTANANIPPSSLWTAVGMGIFTVLYTIAKNKFVPEKYHPYMANMNGMQKSIIQLYLP